MNRLTKIRQQNELNKKEIELNYAGDKGKSWHKQYATSAWIYAGSLPFDLNEGDIIAVFSQYGEIVNINLIRDRKTGKSRGFCYLCYADQRSTNLAVDNFNGIKIVGRIIQVDHVEEYKVPKYKEEVDEDVKKLWEEGCAPKPIQIDEEAAEREAKLREKLLKKETQRAEKQLAKVDDLDEDFKSARKERKKLEKAEKKRQKYERKLAKRLREATPDNERGRPDDDGRWDNKKKRLDEKIDDLDFYGNTEHFNFKSGKRKTPPPPPSHNIRPDFDKADWRDIELFKSIREIDKATKGDKPNNWKEETHYVPKRIH
uniref:RRM domain-containing protein n=1 Tax=Panagrolaimus superbus TaxID=310955 RepID=A0A914XV33_9BILA